jgi:hypothetical protein
MKLHSWHVVAYLQCTVLEVVVRTDASRPIKSRMTLQLASDSSKVDTPTQGNIDFYTKRLFCITNRLNKLILSKNVKWTRAKEPASTTPYRASRFRSLSSFPSLFAVFPRIHRGFAVFHRFPATLFLFQTAHDNKQHQSANGRSLP